jgi:hypothetical protein
MSRTGKGGIAFDYDNVKANYSPFGRLDFPPVESLVKKSPEAEGRQPILKANEGVGEHFQLSVAAAREMRRGSWGCRKGFSRPLLRRPCRFVGNKPFCYRSTQPTLCDGDQ